MTAYVLKAAAFTATLWALWGLLIATDTARRALRRRRARRRFIRGLHATLLLEDLQDAMGRVQPPGSNAGQDTLEHARDESRWLS